MPGTADPGPAPTHHRKQRNALWIAVCLVLTAYGTGYRSERQRHHIIHTTVCAGKEITAHTVVAGDALMGINEISAAFFTPFRLLEQGYWHLAHPIGSNCP